MKTNNKILNLLKTEGEMSAKMLAQALTLTTMGVRQHMLSLEQSGEVDFRDQKALRGRPTRYWFLTEKSEHHFGDRHSELTLQLIESVKQVFGDSGLDKLIESRELSMFKEYQQQLAVCCDLQTKLTKLAQIRTDEGYMAQVVIAEQNLLLIENHCPICSAAKVCQSFCRSELDIFQQLFIEQARVSRVEHIVEGARRCCYLFEPLE
ncbi:helix-turn-helix transcriptional regulator [Shewanella marina]|uniref:helix-turn-helix transcriptional regulator n=1 Tax=Shewanella marina TaxID=487319 RepID=UPI00046EF4DC|nr:metalloregulator ArsR/SmtB family transcription factor [Shewanella marina]